jgi:hypothetical protein
MGPPLRQGAQVLLAQLLEAAQEERRVGATQQLGDECVSSYLDSMSSLR